MTIPSQATINCQSPPAPASMLSAGSGSARNALSGGSYASISAVVSTISESAASIDRDSSRSHPSTGRRSQRQRERIRGGMSEVTLSLAIVPIVLARYRSRCLCGLGQLPGMRQE
jgi:hypothetical protein